MTIDSNIVIAYLAGDAVVIAQLSKWKEEGFPLFLPTAVEAEVLSFSKWSDAERQTTELFLEENFLTIPFDRTIARIAASIRRDARIKLPDAIVAATAVFTSSPLITRNVRDFRMVTGLQLLTIPS